MEQGGWKTDHDSRIPFTIQELLSFLPPVSPFEFLILSRSFLLSWWPLPLLRPFPTSRALNFDLSFLLLFLFTSFLLEQCYEGNLEWKYKFYANNHFFFKHRLSKSMSMSPERIHSKIDARIWNWKQEKAHSRLGVKGNVFKDRWHFLASGCSFHPSNTINSSFLSFFHSLTTDHELFSQDYGSCINQ